jgi:hypothetical protein
MKKQHVLLLGSSPMRVTATHPTAGTHEDAGPLEGSRVPLLFSKPRATIPRLQEGQDKIHMGVRVHKSDFLTLSTTF